MGILRLLIIAIVIMLACLILLPRTKKEKKIKRQVLKATIYICGILVVIFSIALFSLRDSLLVNTSFEHPLIKKIISKKIGDSVFLSDLDMQGLDKGILEESLIASEKIHLLGIKNISKDNIVYIIRILENNNNFTELDLKDISEPSSQVIGDNFNKFNIKKLNLYGLKDAALNNILKALSEYKKLETLSIHDTNLNDNASILLKKLIASNSTLRSLDLKFIGINDQHISKISKALTSTNSLVKLNLWGNKISDLGVKDLAYSLVKNNSVKKIYLGYNNISDIGIKDIANLIKNNNTISYIDLTRNSINDESIYVILESLKENKGIKKIILRSTYFSDKIKDLNEQLKEQGETRVIIDGGL